MSTYNKLLTLILPFTLSYISMLFLPFIIPSVRFLTFAPLITLIMSRFSFHYTLWLTSLIGVLMDLHSINFPLGFFGLNYCLSTLVVYRYKKYFLEEKPHIFALYSVLFSFIATTIHFILSATFEMNIKLHILTFFTDLIFMPILDGIYAFLIVLLPLYCLRTKFINKLKIIATFAVNLKKLRFLWRQYGHRR